METLKELILKCLNYDTLLGALLSSLGMLITFRYSKSFEKFLAMKRVWWRAVAVICLFSTLLLFNNIQGTAWWFILTVVFLVSIIIFSLVQLPHEKWIADYVDNADAESCWIFTIPGRLEFEQAKLAFVKANQKQDAWYRFYELLKNYELFPHEVEDYMFPALEELFQAGAINLVKEEIERLEAAGCEYSRLYELKAYIANKEFRIVDMYDLLDEYLKSSELSYDARLCAHLNLLCAANESNDAEKYKSCIEFAEDAFFNKGVISGTLAYDLLFYYDQNGFPDKATQVVNRIKQHKPTDLQSLFDYSDILFNHYRHLGDRQGQIEVLDAVKTSLQNTKEGGDEEVHLLVELSMLSPLFNVNAFWQEYSCRIFLDSAKYLNYSMRTAATFIAEGLKIMRGADQVYHLGITEDSYRHLLSEMRQAVDCWMPEIEKELAITPKVLLYKRKYLLMCLLDFAAVRYETRLSEMMGCKLDIIERIVCECRTCGDLRELLHFLNVYCDEVLATYKQVSAQRIPMHSLDVQTFQQRYEEFYKPITLGYIKEMEEIIIPNRNNKSINFYVLYLAHHHQLLGNSAQSRFYFNLFESYNIDVRYFNTVTQMIYHDLKYEGHE